jgi:hypothetical protein
VKGKPMSDMTLLKVLRDMSEPFHVHGFRSSLTDWAANEGLPDAVVEAALAHKTPDAVQAAYRRTTYLGTPDQPGARVKLMEAWGRFCASGAVGINNVVSYLATKPDSACHFSAFGNVRRFAVMRIRNSDNVRAAYHRGAHWAERVEMAQWWSDYLDRLRDGG